jgi:hypothetical protein
MKKKLKSLAKYIFPIITDIEKEKIKIQAEIEEIKKLEEVRKKIDSKYN